MAITISSKPSEYSNSSIFVTTTDLVEDSTHINLRLEASLYVNGVVIAKKVKPKGITTFDFTEILNSRCLFTSPAIDDSSGTAIIDGGKTGSNLITAWNNDAHPLDFSTFTVSGANWLEIITDTSGTAKTYTNNISVIAGKVYVIKKTGDSIFEGTPTLQVKTTAANGNILTISGDNKRYYFQARTTGTIALEVVAISSGGPTFGDTYNGNWEMYELNTNDWFCHYYVSFTEKYEDASGVTQTGATTIDSQLSLFFKSDVSTFTDYICTTNEKFLKTDGYNISTNARSYPILKTPPTGYRTSIFNLAVISPKNASILARITPYNSAGTPQTTVDTSLTAIYAPIIGIHLNQSIVATYPRADFQIKSAVSLGYASEVLRYDNVTICYSDIVHLIWQNQTGGLSEYSFLYQLEKATAYEREYYKDVNKKDRVIPTSIIKNQTITAYTALSVTEKQLEYIQDLLESTKVYWQFAADDLREVTVRSEVITTKRDNEFTPFQIEITY